jgi:hypothetical protein
MATGLPIVKFRVRKVGNFSQGYVTDFELVQSMKLAGSLEVTAERDQVPALSVLSERQAGGSPDWLCPEQGAAINCLCFLI